MFARLKGKQGFSFKNDLYINLDNVHVVDARLDDDGKPFHVDIYMGDLGLATTASSCDYELSEFIDALQKKRKTKNVHIGESQESIKIKLNNYRK